MMTIAATLAAPNARADNGRRRLLAAQIFEVLILVRMHRASSDLSHTPRTGVDMREILTRNGANEKPVRLNLIVPPIVPRMVYAQRATIPISLLPDL